MVVGKKYFLAFLMSGFLIYSGEGGELWDYAKKFFVLVDGRAIQRYKGYVGQWRQVGGQREIWRWKASHKGLSAVFDQINTGDLSWAFFPYSQQEVIEVWNSAKKEDLPIEREIRKGQMIWPLRIKDFQITSVMGERNLGFHSGIDLSCAVGTMVFAAQSGVVRISRYYGNYGNLVVIDHANGISTYYAHNRVLLVREGDWVQQGQLISFSGTTGRSTGPHLHFEVRYRDTVYLNPLDFLPPYREDQITQFAKWSIEQKSNYR